VNYESEQMRRVTGPAIRPGGVELTGRAVDFCSFPAGARLLDVGCGEGATVGYMRSHHRMDAAGVDTSSRLLREGKSRDVTLPLVQARAEQLPYGDESFDGVLCECVLSLVPDPECALSEFQRILRPGGRLILSDVYLRELGESLPFSEKTDDCLKGAVTYSVTKSLLEGTGFTVLLWEDHTRCLRELAARLVLADATPTGFCGEFTTAGGGAAHKRPGYYLLVARKEYS
jgi:SAM-dependent methyltransferase